MLPPRVRRLLRLDVHDPARLAADVEEEIAFHIEQRTDQLVRRGVPPAEARAEALRRFGTTYTWQGIHTAARSRETRMRLGDWRDALAHDVRYTTRVLRGSPGFTAIVALTLALGIGANTAIFSIIDGVLLRPLPYPSPELLVSLGDEQGDGSVVPASYPEFEDWRQRGGEIFAAVGAAFSNEATLTGVGEPEVLRGMRISHEMPGLLGMTMLRGRVLGADDDARSAERVVMLSEDLWRRRFGEDPDIVGRVLTINGYPWTVVGVVRSDRRAVLPSGLVSGQRTDVWMPLRCDETVAPRGLHFMTVIAKRRPEISEQVAATRLEALATQLRDEEVTTHGIAMQSATEGVVGDVRGRLVLLLGAVGLVLLIACANVANLLLARAAARQREIAVRVAIGAGQARVASQLLVESVARALLGGVLGVLLAYGAMAIVRTWLAGRIPRIDEVAIDLRMLLFALGLSVVTGLLFGLLPALRAARGDAATALREGGRNMAGGLGHDRLRRGLVIGELALSFVLLAGAALLIRSFERLASVETGFDADRTLTALIVLPFSRYEDSTSQITFYDRLLERTSALPGVRGVALASNLPVEGGTNGGFSIEGIDIPPDAPVVAEKRIVSANYFEVIGARMAEGRSFDRRDVLGAQPVMVVNEAFAKRWFPDRSAVGQRVAFSWGIDGMQTVIGVVADIREGALDQPTAPAMYIHVAQRASDAMNVLVRTTGDPMALVPALRETVLAIDPDLPLSQVRTLDDIIASGIAGPRLSATLVGIFSVLAVLLSAVGLYGVISYSVLQRTHEMGIRTALGARPRDVLQLILGQGLLLTIVGLAGGLVIALALGRVLASQLYGITPNDPSTLALVAALLAAVGLAAAAGPAVRAASIDPIVALRSE